MSMISARSWLLVSAMALPLSLIVHAAAEAQEPAFEVYYTKLDPKGKFKYKWKDKEAVVSAGVFHWEVPKTEFGTNGFDRNFTGYCAEVLVPIVADKLYRFQINSIFDPENYPLEGKDNAETAAERRGRYILELFGRYYRDPLNKTVANPDEVIAFQIALWELIQETEPPEGESKFDLFAGDFQANYPKADAPPYVAIAQGYLETLSGKDSHFYDNVDLRGKELIRLRGIENAEGIVAQSQFALRFVGAAATAPAGGTAQALNSGAAVGGTGAGAPGGGAGGGGGNPGGAGGFINANPTTGGQFFPPPQTPPIVTPPIVTPPVVTPPIGGPDTPTEPIPAPAGLLLGAIALGTFGVWKFGTRIFASK